MAYCAQCGAYIPDGQTKCLACGYDSAQQADAGSYAYNYAYGEEERRKKEEERRERQQRQEEYRRNAEAEFARRQARQAAEERRAQTRANAHPYSSQGNVRQPRRSMSASGNKVLAALSYLSILFLIPFAACPDDEFARYHARQGMLLFFFGLVADAIGSVFSIGWIITLFRLYCIFKGMTNASAGKMEPLPLIGKYADKSAQ